MVHGILKSKSPSGGSIVITIISSSSSRCSGIIVLLLFYLKFIKHITGSKMPRGT